MCLQILEGGSEQVPIDRGAGKRPVPSWLIDSLKEFRLTHGAEAPVKLVDAVGQRCTLRFSGHVAASCCAADYFDDLKAVMEEKTGARFLVWEATLDSSPGREGYEVRYARLDFLPRVLKAMGEVGGLVERRMGEFREAGRDGHSQFNELCFCVLTANYTAEGGAKIQRAIGDGFATLSRGELARLLKAHGHRFPNARATFIAENQRLLPSLQETLRCFGSGPEAREWLVANVRGFGYKEASHFLRNTGQNDVAIIDRHILRFLVKEGLMEEPKTLTPRRYLSIERLLRGIAAELGVSLSELDLYLWYMMTGKVLK